MPDEKKTYCSDRDLVLSVIKGNHNAFRKIMELYEKPLLRIATAMLNNKPEAEDLVQDVFLRFYRNLHQYKGEAALKTYLTKITMNLALNQLKKRKREAWKNADIPIMIPDKTENPYKSFDNKTLISRALEMLPEEFRPVITLRLIEGYSVKETAEILQIPQGTVLSRLSRGQQKLRAIIKNLQKLRTWMI